MSRGSNLHIYTLGWQARQYAKHTLPALAEAVFRRLSWLLAAGEEVDVFALEQLDDLGFGGQGLDDAELRANQGTGGERDCGFVCLGVE
jgi:hypothetical protein